MHIHIFHAKVHLFQEFFMLSYKCYTVFKLAKYLEMNLLDDTTHALWNGVGSNLV